MPLTQNLLIILTLTLLTRNHIAFQTNLPSKPISILKNETIRNRSTDQSTQECSYFRDWQAKYASNSSKSKFIFYFAMQCLDSNMMVVRSSVKFNYDGQADTYDLPEGCMAPIIDPPKESPCKNGTLFGANILGAVSELLTKKIVFHAETVAKNEPHGQILTQEKLDEISRRMPELAEILEKLNHENEAQNILNRTIDKKITNSDGTITLVYRFKDGTQAYRTKELDGTVLTEILLTSGERLERRDPKDKPSEEVLKDPKGKIKWIRNIIPIAGDFKPYKTLYENDAKAKRWELVSTYNIKRELMGVPILKIHHPLREPIWVQIPDEIRDAFEETSAFYSSSLEAYVMDKMKCFTKQILNVPELYLTFVCATTQQDSPGQILKMHLAKALVCGKKVDCSPVEFETIMHLMYGVGKGQDQADLKAMFDSIR